MGGRSHADCELLHIAGDLFASATVRGIGFNASDHFGRFTDLPARRATVPVVVQGIFDDLNPETRSLWDYRDVP